jgi:hypothetical protein
MLLLRGFILSFVCTLTKEFSIIGLHGRYCFNPFTVKNGTVCREVLVSRNSTERLGKNNKIKVVEK